MTLRWGHIKKSQRTLIFRQECRLTHYNRWSYTYLFWLERLEHPVVYSRYIFCCNNSNNTWDFLQKRDENNCYSSIIYKTTFLACYFYRCWSPLISKWLFICDRKWWCMFWVILHVSLSLMIRFNKTESAIFTH